MRFISNSFSLSIPVALQMIVPIVLILLISNIVWLIPNLLTLLLTAILAPFSLTFIALLGICVAFDQKGKGGPISWNSLAIYSIIFSLLFAAADAVGLVVSGFLTTLTSQSSWVVGYDIVSLFSSGKDSALQININILTLTGLMVLLVKSAIYALFAVPLAAAAHNAGSKSQGGPVFSYIGASFFQLFILIFIAFIFKSIFISSAVLAFIFGGVLSGLFSFVETAADSFSEQGIAGITTWISQIDPVGPLTFVTSIFLALWLQAWIWSAAALAFLKHDSTPAKRPVATRQVPAVTPTDLRALRKARDSRTN